MYDFTNPVRQHTPTEKISFSNILALAHPSHRTSDFYMSKKRVKEHYDACITLGLTDAAESIKEQWGI